MNKHTPAPWKAAHAIAEGSIFSDSGRTRLEDGGTTLYPICSYNRGWNADEDAANARLIASAPDLLQALLSILEHSREFGDIEDHETMLVRIQDKARAAISKATGDAQ
jgi:hypothetical protein